jgi:uncharacterized damage-inducible protein DinB
MNTLESLFAQKSWANNELFNLLASVTAEQHADVLHAATRLLNHIHVVDRIFQAHLLGQPHGYSATNTEATPDLGALQFAVAETDAWFMAYTATSMGCTSSNFDFDLNSSMYSEAASNREMYF